MADIPSTPADGNVKVAIVPAIANPEAPTVAELTAAEVVDISCYLTADGLAPALSEGTITDNRLCDTETYEQPGRVARTLSTTYIENPGDTEFNVAYDTLVPGTATYMVARRGVPFDQPFAAGDIVDVWPIKPGQYSPLAPEADSVLRVTQKQFVTARVRTDVAIVTAV